MKKTSKKLLSLFLAVVMIITSCSVGLTAFAADQPSDSYWSNKSDAEAAFDSLNDLVDEYVPMLLNIDAIKNILENNLGMTVDENTTISDVVVGASPLLLGLLGGNANKAEIRGTNSPLADKYFAYLEDDTGAMDFYSLYKFCKDNKDKGGEVGAYASETFPKLEALLNVYKNAESELNDAVSEGDSLIQEYSDIAYEDETINDVYGGLESAPLRAIENVVIDSEGTLLKDVPLGAAAEAVQMINGFALTPLRNTSTISPVWVNISSSPKFFSVLLKRADCLL